MGAIWSLPLPADHWLYKDREYVGNNCDPVDLPPPFLVRTVANEELIRIAVRYAIRRATNCGKEPDFDPDALVLNAVYAVFGPMRGYVSEAAANSELIEQLTSAQMEIKRLTAALKEANANHEEYERKYYLAEDEIEKLIDELKVYK